MKRIAALALIAALGASAASAQDIKPVTSTQAPLIGGLAPGVVLTVAVVVVTVAAAVSADSTVASGT